MGGIFIFPDFARSSDPQNVYYMVRQSRVRSQTVSTSETNMAGCADANVVYDDDFC